MNIKLTIDFCTLAQQTRILPHILKRDPLIRALGLAKNANVTILDATAGTGQDSFLMAACGANIILFEKEIQIYTLLADALQRAKSDSTVGTIVNRMYLLQQDMLSCPQLDTTIDIVYLDPMFPAKKKKALPKKKMQLFQELFSSATFPSDASYWEAALHYEPKRIVVKRPRTGSCLINTVNPTYQIFGKSHRFDVYELARRCYA